MSYRTTRLKVAVVCCLALFGLQLFGGYVTHSLALYADAFHMLSDVIGYIVSLAAIYAAARTSGKGGYGSGRVEVMGAAFCVALVWALTVGLVAEAWERLLNPEPIDGNSSFVLCCLSATVRYHCSIIV